NKIMLLNLRGELMINNNGNNVTCNVKECVYNENSFCKCLGKNNLKPDDKEKCIKYENGII
ncbi:MAG: hypothetical protein ACOCRK_01920, partial [bacterium]